MPISAIIGPSSTIIVGLANSSTSTPSSTSSSSPTASTSSPVIVDGPAPNLPSSSSPSLTSSPATETTAAASSQATATAQAQGTPAGSIAGLVIGLLLLVGLILFGVRWFFIRKREHKTTPARSRISRLNISGPSNFTHLQSGAAVGMAGTHTTVGAGADRINAQTAPASQVSRSAATTDPNAAAASPYDRIKQKYSFDLNQLETGLSDHMETMKTSRKNAPSY
ncbi:hypothetical protein PIIN_08187 [Serendipita indica DSM 11827]|uniref:Uncharacterized protein n=1 Tax=Serendipita indica (strain DSM 11827) TaxID=1109443 RepID=G4TSE1_SERID|nr:hypothetical protein PIIN_08187 [Serendipita indica DSM 11827]